jgi:hypothetical protein
MRPQKLKSPENAWCKMTYISPHQYCLSSFCMSTFVPLRHTGVTSAKEVGGKTVWARITALPYQQILIKASFYLSVGKAFDVCGNFVIFDKPLNLFTQ